MGFPNQATKKREVPKLVVLSTHTPTYRCITVMAKVSVRNDSIVAKWYHVQSLIQSSYLNKT